jgi:ATP-dependent protease HslVU (ClpYQ) peptidase subunit
VADEEHVYILSGNGDVIEPDSGVRRHRLGRDHRAKRPRVALLANTDLDARAHRRKGHDHRRRYLHLHQPQSRLQEIG